VTGPESRDDVELFAEIDRSAKDEAERHDSKAIYDALKRHAPAVGGQAALPDDRQLSERILSEARTRSAEVAAAKRTASARLQAQSAPIPWWVIIGWVLAIAALAAAWRWLG